jgi:uncharacterized protein YjdB
MPAVNASGVVAGVAAGTASINYVSNWWHVVLPRLTRTVTVNAVTPPLPPVQVLLPAHPAYVPEHTIALTKSVAGGAWSSTAPGVATVNASGVVTGVAAGTATIKYTVGTAVATKAVTVNAAPSAGVITGTATVNS